MTFLPLSQEFTRDKGLGIGSAPIVWAGTEIWPCSPPKGHPWALWEESVVLCGGGPQSPLLKSQEVGNAVSLELTQTHCPVTPESQY